MVLKNYDKKMSKGISAVIATVLMLVITISVASLAWMHVSGFLGGRIEQTFSIIHAYHGKVVVRNDGTAPISSMSGIVDGKSVEVLFPDGPIESGSSGTIILQGLPATKQKHHLRLCSQTMCNVWYWEYPIIALYDADGENFYAYAWGRFSSNQIYEWLISEGFAVAKISSNNLAGYHWGFEKGMSGWTTQNSPDEATIVKDIKRSGESSLKVRVDSPKAWSGVITENNFLIRVKPNTRYLGEVYVYVPPPVSLTGKWEFHRHVYDENGCGDGTCHHYDFIEGDIQFDDTIEKGRWIRKWFIIKTWGDAQTFRAFFVTHGIGGTGTVYWDDFQLIELDEDNNPVEPKRIELRDADVWIISTGEGYPARGKSYENRGENIWENIKEYLRNNGRMLVIGAYPFYYPCRWDGSSWVKDCALAPCYSAAARELQLHFWDVDGTSIVKTEEGKKYFPNSANSAPERDRRPLKGWPGEFNPENQLFRFWNTDTGNYAISMVRYRDGVYNGKLLKVSGGGPDHVTALGGKTFLVEAILTLLDS